MQEIGVGVVGCGNISTIYFTNLPHSPGVTVRACADMRPEAAEAQAKRFGIEAMSVDALLKRDDIDIVVNLTIPAAHATVSLAALSAGKHVFSEKPLAVDADLGRKVMAEAEWRRLLVGCAPDTFLGGGGRLTRKLIDEGRIGQVLSGTSFLMSHGMEHWHPDPEFFFKAGGGPVLDVGVYYITALVNLLGPIAKVTSLTSTGFPERIVTSEGPRKGYRITVETPTTALAMLEFAAGTQMMFGATWDVWKHGHHPIELYGTEGSIRVPDPNFYGGVVEVSERGGDWTMHSADKMPLGRPNWPADAPRHANYRALGIAEMAMAIRTGKPHHASGALGLHVLEVMEAIVRGGTSEIASDAKRPDVFTEEDAGAVFDAKVSKPSVARPAAGVRGRKRPAAKKPGKKASRSSARPAKQAKRLPAKAKRPVAGKAKRPVAGKAKRPVTGKAKKARRGR